jgi:hypothetical protein
MTRTMPFFCHTNRRSSGAKAMPTRVKGGRVAIRSVANPDPEKVSAAAGCWNDTRPATTATATTKRLK